MRQVFAKGQFTHKLDWIGPSIFRPVLWNELFERNHLWKRQIPPSDSRNWLSAAFYISDWLTCTVCGQIFFLRAVSRSTILYAWYSIAAQIKGLDCCQIFYTFLLTLVYFIGLCHAAINHNYKYFKAFFKKWPFEDPTHLTKENGLILETLKQMLRFKN